MRDTERAERLARDLLSGFASGKPILLGKTNVFVADIAADLERFGQFIKWSWKFSDMPCMLDDDGPLPLDISTAPPVLSFMNVRHETPLFFFSEAFPNLKFPNLKFVGVPVQEIKEILKRRTARFLAVRYSVEEDEGPRVRAVSLGAASRGFTGGPAGYLSLQVRTRESGLRIHFSPAYLGTWANVFGAPTTPVDGWIRPGRYKFGGMRSDGTFLIDPATFDIPPLNAASLSF